MTHPPAEGRPAAGQPAPGHPAGGQPTAGRSDEARAAEGRPAAGQPVDRPPEDPQPPDGIPTSRVTLCWHGATLVLLPGGLVHWPAAEALFVADLHLGKAELFRRQGLPLPEGNDREDLARLRRALEATGARHLVVLGDLVHGAESWTPALAEGLARILPPVRTLVRGNHDRVLPPASLGFQVVDEGWTRAGLALRHAPLLGDPTAPPHLAGHLHPVARLAGQGDRLRIPCFVLTPRTLLLPAWGSLTGGHPWPARPGERRILDVRDPEGGAGRLLPLAVGA